MTMIKEYTLKVEKKNSAFEKVKINTSEAAYNYIKQFYKDDILIYESFFILLLNRFNMTIGYAKISQGGVTGTVVDEKIIAKYAIDTLASNVILAHNHPSGNTLPSDSDAKITKQVQKALDLFKISVIDHIILTEHSYYSMSDNGLL
jgi:DNA repair protein RadC